MSKLADGGHSYLSCSDCNAWLVDVWVTRPNEEMVWKLQAECPFCGDRSFVTELKGGFHYGGAYTPNPEDPDDQFLSTRIETADLVTQNNDTIVLFKVIKAEPDAKPIRQPR